MTLNRIYLQPERMTAKNNYLSLASLRLATIMCSIMRSNNTWEVKNDDLKTQHIVVIIIIIGPTAPGFRWNSSISCHSCVTLVSLEYIIHNIWAYSRCICNELFVMLFGLFSALWCACDGHWKWLNEFRVENVPLDCSYNVESISMDMIHLRRS